MAKDITPIKQLSPRTTWFDLLLLLDAFVLGGLIAMRLVLQHLESSMDVVIGIEAQDEILNELDHLAAYWMGYIGASLLLALLTIGAYAYLRTRPRVVSP